MRKIYSILLIACSMLISANIQAQQKTVYLYKAGGLVAKYATLQAAVNDVNAGETATIVLEDNQELSAPVVIPQVGTSKTDTVAAANKVANRKMQHITLDMNGYDIYAADSYYGSLFILLKGDLNIIGEGTVSRNEASSDKWKGPWVNFSAASIVICGADGDKTNAANDRSKQEWSVLTIGEKVTIAGLGHATDGKKGCYGIAIQDIAPNATYGNNAVYYPELDQYVHYVNLGYTTYNNYESTTNRINPMWFRSNKNGNKDKDKEQGSAFGVKIIIKGTVKGYQRGINIVGHINQQPDTVPSSDFYTGETKPRSAEYPFYTHYYPYIKIEKDAKVYSTGDGMTSGNGGIYGGGWCVVDICGEVYGQTGVYLKGGDVKITDGTIYSTSSTGVSNGDYKGTVSGSAIFITTDDSYAGNTGVVIEGDSKITGNGGTAITDVVSSNSDGNAKVEHITITGGTIEGGSQGAIAVTAGGAAATTVYGGGIEGTIKKDGNEIPTTDITAQGTHTTTVTVGGKTTIVVSTGAAPKDLPNVYNTPVKDSVNWTGTTETLADNLTLKELEINQTYAQVLTVPNGVTLNVEHLVMGENGKIIVEAGGKFVVTGTQGIVAPVTSNIILKTNEATPAEFLFKPTVTSNRHPNATVQLIANSYTSATEPAVDYLYQRFGVPTYTAVKAVSATKNNADVQVFFRKYQNNGWLALGYINVPGQSLNLNKLNEPFGYYSLQCNTPEVGTIVSMSGELVGNVNATLTTGQNTNGWSTYANSYTAKMGVSAMMDMFEGLPAGTNAAVYIQKNVSGTDNYFDWETYDKTSAVFLGSKQLNPMQAFLIKDPDAEVTTSLALNYETMVWTPGTTAAPARLATSDMTMASIQVYNANVQKDAVYMIESNQFSADIENGYDSEKYMGGKANLYIMNDAKYATCATNDLNNTYLGFSCAETGLYTLSFENIAGESLALVDLTNNKVIDIVEGATYEFNADENENDYRFQIIKRQEVPTDLENVNNNIKANGIYTITGQYMGNMSVWNTLPAGIYVVDGAKKIK